jgi:hypothetical protein
LKRSRVLRKLITNITTECISLSNGVEIQVYPCSVGKIRGVSLISFVGDECAYWKVEGKDVDEMVLESARPALDFEYSKLIKISTPYMQKGEIYQDFRQYFGKPNSDVLVFRGSTELFNPSYSRRKMERMKRRSAVSYATEYEAQFRSDLSAMYDPEAIDAAVNHDRPAEIPPQEDVHYVAFVDVAGGGGKDSYALAIAHMEDQRVIVDVVRSRAPKFNPEEVTAQYCGLLKQYGVHSVVGDKFSGDWASNSLASHGIFYERSPKTKSELYIESEGAFNTGRVEIPDRETLITQLKCLVRKTRPGGKDSVDADVPEDEANVVAGAVWQLLSFEYEKPIPPSLGISARLSSGESLDSRAVAWLLGRRENLMPEESEEERELREIDREIEQERQKSEGVIKPWK